MFHLRRNLPRLPSVSTCSQKLTPTSKISISMGYRSRANLSTSTSEKDSERKIPSKDTLNPSSKEQTRSGTNDQVAHDDNAAWNPENTSPVEQKKSAGNPESGNPLDFSPATPEVSRQLVDRRPEKSGGGREKASGGSKSA